MPRVLAFALLAGLLSCDVAAIPTPADPAAPADDGFEPAPDWPRLPAGKQLGRVLGVAVAPDGRVWVSHTADGGARNTTPIPGPTLAVLDPTTGELLAEHGAGMFLLPHGLSFDGDGRLWVTDADANAVVVLDVTSSPRVVLRLGAP